MPVRVATVRAADVPATQTNFPFYVDLGRVGATALTLADANSSRWYTDTDLVTQMAREIVSLTEGHGKYASLTSTSKIAIDYDGIRADYAVTATYGRNNVWGDFESVQHFQSNSNDSTANGRNGSDSGITYTTGKFGQSASNLSGSGKITLPSFSLSAAFSSSFWVKYNALQATAIFSTYGGANGSSTGANIANSFPYINGSLQSGYTNFLVDAGWVASGQTTGVWYKFNYVHDGTTIRIYLNGVQVNSGNVPHSTVDRVMYLMSRGDNAQALNGYLDEFYIKNSQDSANWITTEYNNQNDEATFWGTWTTFGGGPAAVNARRLFLMMV